MGILLTVVNIYLFSILIRSLYTLCTGFLYVKKHTSVKGANEYNPLVSVIVPAWNEEIGLKKTVLSVINNHYSNIEIIIINDGSKDNTQLIGESLSAEYPEKVFIYQQENKGKAEALNYGILKSKGEIVFTIDADSYIDKNAIKYMVTALADPYYDCAVGTVKIGNTKTIAGLAQYFEYSFGFHTKKSQSLHNSIYILPGALCAIRKKVFDTVGLYESYSKTEDFDISLKIRSNGFNVVHVDDAVCITEGASTLSGLLNQRTRWKHGAIQCLIHHKNLFFNTKKHKYLSFVELPIAIISLFDLIMYPFFIIYIYTVAIIMHDYVSFIMFYFILPFAFVLIMDADLKDNKKIRKYFLLIPLLFNLITLIEFLAFFKAMWRIIRKRETVWTNWVRVGV